MLRALGWLAWLGHGTLAILFFSAAVGAASQDGLGGIILTAVAISLLPTLVVIVHLKRSGELCELDRALWRLLLLWGGPLAGAAYLTVQDRRISDSPAGQLLRLFLD